MSEQIRSFIAFDMQNEQVLSRLAAAQKLLVETGADLRPVATAKHPYNDQIFG